MVLLYIIFLLKINLILSNIIIPFTTIKENITSDTPSTFMYFYFQNKIETLIKIGTPSQDIPLRIKTLRYPISINSVEMGTYKIIRFNQTESSSYISISERPSYFGEHDFTNALKSKDIIQFNNHSLILDNFTFLLGVVDMGYHKESGVLGLKLPEFDWRILDVCFIKQIKERELIEKYMFFIKYNENDDNGEVIFGSFPHEVYPNKYDVKKYDEFYATIVSNSLGFLISEALYGEDIIDTEFKVELAVEENLIRGTEAFKSFLKEKFFQKYIDRKICQSSVFSYLDNEKNEFFYCSKKLNLTDFKNIILPITDSKITIVLDYKDLFIEYNDNYYFIIYFPTTTYSNTYFRLGKILFKKFTLSFNYENKKIGYYIKDENENNDNKNIETTDDNNKKTYYYLIPWIIVIVLIIIIALLSFYILYYKPWKNRSKRANELQDDNYSYEGINE